PPDNSKTMYDLFYSMFRSIGRRVRMGDCNGLGRIIILNGPPRSGKSTIAAKIQEEFDGLWINFGVDHMMKMIPNRYQPSIGLRPGGERPDLESHIEKLYLGMYNAIASF